VNEFFSMGGYGRYLWPAFALGFGVVILNMVLAVRALNAAKEQARRRLEMAK
jgi:heme exporter protein CcmD